jgi:hypothetical protein
MLAKREVAQQLAVAWMMCQVNIKKLFIERLGQGDGTCNVSERYCLREK